MEAIKSLKNKLGGSDLFGVEKDASFHSSIGQGITACYRRGDYRSVKCNKL